MRETITESERSYLQVLFSEKQNAEQSLNHYVNFLHRVYQLDPQGGDKLDLDGTVTRAKKPKKTKEE